MMEQYRKDMEAGNAPLVFSRAKIAFRGLASELLKRGRELTKQQHEAAKMVQEAFEA